MIRILFLLGFIVALPLFAQVKPIWKDIAGSAYLENKSYEALRRICDEAGGRLPGTPENEKAMRILGEELIKLGFNPVIEEFTMPGWKRGEDEIELTSPLKRKLRAIALGFTDSAPEFEAQAVYAGYGFEEEYEGLAPEGKIAVVTQERPPNGHQLLRYEAIDIAAGLGARAILFINNKEGGALLGGVANFQGAPSPIPAFSITLEEGLWIKRLLEKGISAKMKIRVKSRAFKEMKSANQIVRLEGESGKKIVIGAHFDSWDMGHGGVDNGQGTALLIDIARLIKEYSPNNKHTIDFVWFNAEELGLWGSRRYYETHAEEGILAMINMDMTGIPTGVNVMGYDSLAPFFEELLPKLGGFNIKHGVTSHPWANSDHFYFMIHGIPSITFHSHLEKRMVKYYHDFADTFDKADKQFLSRGAAVISILLYEMANADESVYPHKSAGEIKEMLIEHGLDEQLEKQGWPPFVEN